MGKKDKVDVKAKSEKAVVNSKKGKVNDRFLCYPFPSCRGTKIRKKVIGFMKSKDADRPEARINSLKSTSILMGSQAYWMMISPTNPYNVDVSAGEL